MFNRKNQKEEGDGDSKNTNVVTLEATSDVESTHHQIRGLENVDVDRQNLAKTQYQHRFLGLFGSKKQPFDLDSVATQPSVYDDLDKAPHYWPRSDYENIHRFDTDARWTWREELAVIKKVDLRIMLWAIVMFFGLEIDRSNLSQALSDNFLADLGMNTNDYNNGQMIFRASFLVAELPSQLISKRIGPDRWIPAQITMWSIVALFQFFLKNRASFYVTRCLLGLIQGGFIPDVILYLSYFYTGRELPIRCSWFWVGMYVADIVSAFLGFGILHMRGVQGQSGWRWLFLLEGIMTLCIGLLSFGLMPSSPTSTASWFRGKKGWFSEREETIITTRALRDDPTKGDMHNRQAISFRVFKACIKDYGLWPLYLIGLLYGIPHGPVNSYLTLSLRQLGFDTFETNLLTIPSYVLVLVNLLIFTYASEVLNSKFNSRTIITSLAQWWMLPLIIALNTFSEKTNTWVKYVVTTLIVGWPYPHAIQVAWCSRNANTVGSRTVAAALYNISVQLSNIVYSQIYREDDKPQYRRGNKILLAFVCLNIVVYAGTYVYYWNLNRKKDRIWNQMSSEEQFDYIQNTKDIGSRRLDFRYAY
ncbi:hypothetical protein TRICI_002872 [Trichomonascus ciferrii]|uniref:Major facilitator superfamily (MFS) profile domain-containing protein n=1 Tax=Trichomonascus ciferrii TaxID=44093 RepID=A0A642V5H0_9ASCO|nr:hypothetical protein TRICI_002872 [Trichomonascus ciferrii]